MADTATPPAPPPDPKPPAPPPNPPTPPPPPPKPSNDGLTLADVEKREQAMRDEFARLLAERETAWEAKRVPQLRDQIREEITAPLRRDGKIRALREELKASGKYLPADDDDTDPTSPGDIAALANLDDSKPVAKAKDGKELTQLDIELNRVRARLGKRKAADAADPLRTPPGGDVPPDVWKAIRDKAVADEAAARDARRSGLDRVFGKAH